VTYLRQFFELWWLFPLFIAAGAVALAPGVRDGVKYLLHSVAGRVARSRWGGPVVVGLVALLAGAVPTWTGHVTPPQIADEFSYMLAADTFLHGRLTNPRHPLHRHFQSIHILTRPTYASKYPPGQGLALAAGWALGSPRLGAYGAVALACAATCWALGAAMPARWALIAALMLAFQPLVFLWGQIFWGGGVAMLGGALVIGAALRARRGASLALGIIAGVGLTILANSRPYEGLLLALALGVWLAFVALARGQLTDLALRFGAGAGIVLLPVAVWSMYYNYRVTGHATRPPYVEHASQYTASPLFYWERPRTKLIDVPHLAAFHKEYEYYEYKRETTLKGFAEGLVRKLTDLLCNTFLTLPLALVPAAGAWLAWKGNPFVRLAVLTCAAVVAIHLFTTPFLRLHYLSMLAPLVAGFVTLALLELARRFTRRGGAVLARALAVATLVTLTVALPRVILKHVSDAQPQPPARDKLEREILARYPGKHLVVVRYADGPHQPHEWVYNTADIDAQAVVYAHVLDDASNARLAAYYKDRSVWLLTVADLKYQLEPLALKH
jgi:hypothetical protein